MKVRPELLFLTCLLTVVTCHRWNRQIQSEDSPFPRCGFGRYDPDAETCCGSVAVSKARDLLCCKQQLVNNPTGTLLCCQQRGYDPRIQMCMDDGRVVQFVNTERTVIENPAHRMIEVGVDGGLVSSIVGRQPMSRVDARGLHAREIKLPSTPYRPAIVRNVFGQDILNCNGKIHTLTDKSMYGFYSCCGCEVYNWLYYACLDNRRVVLVEDAQWPSPRLVDVVASVEQKTKPHDRPCRNCEKDSAASHSNSERDSRQFRPLEFLRRQNQFEHARRVDRSRERSESKSRQSKSQEHRSDSVEVWSKHFNPLSEFIGRQSRLEDAVVSCQKKQFYLRLPIVRTLRCCGDNLLDSKKFTCQNGFFDPERVVNVNIDAASRGYGQVGRGGEFIDVASGDLIVVP